MGYSVMAEGFLCHQVPHSGNPSFSSGRGKTPLGKANLFSIRSMLLDHFSMQLLSLLLPTVQNIKVLCFSDCGLDVEMLHLLRQGLAGSCHIEALQVEWNPVDLPMSAVEVHENGSPDKDGGQGGADAPTEAGASRQVRKTRTISRPENAVDT